MMDHNKRKKYNIMDDETEDGDIVDQENKMMKKSNNNILGFFRWLFCCEPWLPC